jgi:hypothetical protein
MKSFTMGNFRTLQPKDAADNFADDLIIPCKHCGSPLSYSPNAGTGLPEKERLSAVAASISCTSNCEASAVAQAAAAGQ